MFGYDRKHGFYVYDPTTNYCGPNYSDGKVQPSVIHGESEPLNTRDTNCRAHDTCYAIANSDSDAFDRCDNSFYERSKKDNLLGKAYGYAVLYGNRLIRKKTNSLRKGKDTMAQAQNSVYMPGSFKHPKSGLINDPRIDTFVSEPDLKPEVHGRLNPKDDTVLNMVDERQRAYEQKRNKASDTPPSTGQANKAKIHEIPKPGKGANAPDAGYGGFRIIQGGAQRVRSKYSSNKKKKKKGILTSLHNIKNKLNRVHLA